MSFPTCETHEPEKDACSSELYAGASRKLGVDLLMICSLSIRFKLSDEALNYIISIIEILLPSRHNMIKSVYVLKDHLRKFVSFPTIHHLCSFCGTRVDEDSKRCINQLFEIPFSARSSWILYSIFSYKTTATYV